MFFKKFKFSLEKGHSKFNFKLVPEKRLVKENDGEFHLTTKYIRPDKDIQSILIKYPQLESKYKEYLNKYDYALYDNFHNLQYLSKFLTLDSFNKSNSSYKELKMYIDKDIFNDEGISALSILKDNEYKENQDLFKDIISFSILFTGLKGILPELRERDLNNLLNNENFLNELKIETLYFSVKPETGYMYLSTDLKYKHIKLSRNIIINPLDKFIHLKNLFLTIKDNKPISIENMLFYQVSLIELLKDMYSLDDYNIITKAKTSSSYELMGAGIWLRKGYSLSDTVDLFNIYNYLSRLMINDTLSLSELFINFNEFNTLINTIENLSNKKKITDFSAKDNFELFNKLINFEFEFYNKNDINYLFIYFNNLIKYYTNKNFINKIKNILSVMKDRAINENKIRLFDLLKFIDNEYFAHINDKDEFILNLLAREKL